MNRIDAVGVDVGGSEPVAVNSVVGQQVGRNKGYIVGDICRNNKHRNLYTFVVSKKLKL